MEKFDFFLLRLGSADADIADAAGVVERAKPHITAEEGFIFSLQDRLGEILTAAAKARGKNLNINPSNGIVTPYSILLDGVVIEKPADEANRLTVIFRGASLGVNGDFVFEIPRTLWEHAAK